MTRTITVIVKPGSKRPGDPRRGRCPRRARPRSSHRRGSERRVYPRARRSISGSAVVGRIARNVLARSRRLRQCRFSRSLSASGNRTVASGTWWSGAASPPARIGGRVRDARSGHKVGTISRVRVGKKLLMPRPHEDLKRHTLTDHTVGGPIVVLAPGSWWVTCSLKSIPKIGGEFRG
jgi:hypothetical protein